MLSSTADLPSKPPTASFTAAGEIAAVRSAMYTLCSELVGSPFEIPEGTSLAASAAELVTLLPALPFAIELPQLTLARLDSQLNDARRCRRQYSGLFEVGDRGPPIAIRESLALSRDTGVKERLMRLFDLFEYAVDDHDAGACDHIAVELAFLHWLCFREARAEDPNQRSSYQYAQRDFLAAHVLAWLPELARKVGLMAPAGPYKQVFSSVHTLAAADLAYCGASPGPPIPGPAGKRG